MARGHPEEGGGGQPVRVRGQPGQVGVQVNTEPVLFSLVREDTVITAAHCVDKLSKDQLR